MMRLREWLSALVCTPEQEKVRDASIVLVDQIRAKGVVLMLSMDAWRFRDTVEMEYRRAMVGSAPLPLLARHADPIARYIAPGSFLGFIGTYPSLPAPLVLTSTGAMYPLGTIRRLFETQRLWCDRDEDRQYQNVVVEGNAPELDDLKTFVHCGTTWARPDRGNNGLGQLISRLCVKVCWLQWGTPIFSTVVDGKGLEKTFSIPRVIGKAICDGLVTNIGYFTEADHLADSEKVLSMSTTAA